MEKNRFLVKVRVRLSTMGEFGKKLQAGGLDRSCIQSETYCVKSDPAVGYSVWEAKNKAEFEEKFCSWRIYYEDVEVIEVVSPQNAMQQLMGKIKL